MYPGDPPKKVRISRRRVEEMDLEYARDVLATVGVSYGYGDAGCPDRARTLALRKRAEARVMCEYGKPAKPAKPTNAVPRHGEKRAHGAQAVSPRIRTRESRRSRRQATITSRSSARGDSGDSDPAPSLEGFPRCYAERVAAWFRSRISTLPSCRGRWSR